MTLYKELQPFINNLKTKCGEFPEDNLQIVCHNDADGICAALLAQEFFPTKNITPVSNDEAKKFIISEDKLYLFLDIQPANILDNIFCIDHHYFSERETAETISNNVFIQNLSGLPNAASFLAEYVAHIFHGNVSQKLSSFAKSFKKSKKYQTIPKYRRRLEVLMCGLICDNAHQLNNKNSHVRKLSGFSKKKLDSLREVSLGLTFEVSCENLKKRKDYTGKILSAFSKNYHIRNFVSKEMLKSAIFIPEFSKKLSKKVKKDTKGVFIYLSSKQRNNQVKGILATYVYSAIQPKHLLVLENSGGNSASWSIRADKWDFALTIFNKVFEKYNNAGSGGRGGMGGGTINQLNPSLDKLSFDHILGRLPDDWEIVEISGDILENPEIPKSW